MKNINKILRQLAGIFPYGFKNNAKHKLIMTLLVRDEVDIIRQNIDFHLNHGVDFIIATDNGSVDGTKEILEDYQGIGKLYLIEEPNQDYSQSDWVNRMGKIAFEKYDADIILHCDADEFWFSRSGNLKNEILESRADVLAVDLINVLLRDREGREGFPDDTVYAIVNPIETTDLEEDSKETGLFFFRYPSKVIFKTNEKFFEVNPGNHGVTDNSAKTDKSTDIVIYHYPIRGREHFYQKVINGGAAYERNKRLAENIGFHWRRWFNAYNEGELDLEYKRLIITDDKAKELMSSGSAEVIEFEKIILN